MIDKVHALWPEICLFITTCIVMVLGVSRRKSTRQSTEPIAYIGLFISFILAYYTTPEGAGPLPHLALFGKCLVAAMGMLIFMLLDGLADREYEAAVEKGQAAFDPISSTRGEFTAFYLFSLTGLMLCAGADDLIWLFLALELTSLPTYVMVALSSRRNRSMEAAVKYFFLGAMGAAVFLYGFALLYGGTGTTNLSRIGLAVTAQMADGGLNALTLAGAILAIVGICFKIAAVPMHFYTPDVYQGSAAPVAGMLAFVPKAAGFFAILLICGAIGWRFGDNASSLPEPLWAVLWIIAALTMTIGNVLALLQTSIKRILAYSSIAHSGYMLVGVIAGPGVTASGLRAGTEFSRSGVAAVLFYLACYGVMTMGAFAVVGCLERRRGTADAEEADSLSDIKGLCRTSPALGWTLVICSMGLLGLPPLLGFLGKLPLFTSAISAGEIPLVLVLGVNSAIAAWYYLGLAKAALLEKPEEHPTLPPVVESPFPARKTAGLLSAAGVIILAIGGRQLADAATVAGRTRSYQSQTQPGGLPSTMDTDAPAETVPQADAGIESPLSSAISR